MLQHSGRRFRLYPHKAKFTDRHGNQKQKWALPSKEWWTTSGRIGMMKKPMSAETAEVGKEIGVRRQKTAEILTGVSAVALLEFPASMRLIQRRRSLLAVFAQF